MSRFVPIFVAVSLAGLSAACAPTIGSNGFQAIDAKPQDIVAGTDTKETVLARLGSPSTTSTFEPDQVWYYISQTTEKYTYNRPVISSRTITEVTFEPNGDKVAAVRTLGLADGEQIAMNTKETPTRGRELTVLEQLLGNVGRGQLPRTEDDTPGQRRPD
ncbi:MAG: outer membrane protein assembly factor BamE [Brevundimonas sp.]|uniref:outer membrane protein assembly factor BamE n=1 Tax=Brevundimonas sp. TaxID=1871086 RepID=UPI0027272B0A|nr:outer membrane protein assembly factor BamE [Brevundimonas sp.]MDO9608708.1 outer membrane protein assembly factor BamE [Brevundimonas sp.]